MKPGSKVVTVIYLFFIVFLLSDIVYTVFQNLQVPLDGDIAESVVPIKSIEPLMKDPLGVSTIINNEYHHNPNRFFSHGSLYAFFRTLPFALQNFTDPIESVYWTSAIAKIIMQLLLIYLLSVCISGSFGILSKNFLLAAVLITPLFQTNGFNNNMGIISNSITYSFFYALPCIFLIIYFLPLFIEIIQDKKIKLNIPLKIIWIALALVVSLSGSLNPGISLIISMLLIINNLYRSYKNIDEGNFFSRIWESIKKIPSGYYFYLVPICILSLYSLYLGQFNSANFWEEKSILELYKKLPLGLFYILTEKPWFMYILIILVINIVILYRSRSEGSKKILKAFKWVGIFILIYILLLPLGGYRSYRPYVIRHDTFVPATICIVFLFGLSSYYLIRELKVKKLYYLPVLAVLIVFTVADKPYPHTSNDCEKYSLKEIASSQNEIVELKNSCNVLSWRPIYDPKNSEDNAELLKIWNITSEKKLYYNSVEE